MDKKKITSVSNFIEIIEQFQSKNLLGQIYYRGQHNGFKQNWKLIPSFYRKKKIHEKHISNNHDGDDGHPMSDIVRKR